MSSKAEKQIPLTPPFAKGEDNPSSGIIGVFDSGVGGLSVLHHIRQLLPHEQLIYVADSGHVPYGDKSPAYIEARSLAITRFLTEQGADAIVIACNTATAAAAHTLRVKFNKVPIVGMEPAVKPAVAATKSGVVGVLATVGTLESARFAALLEKYAGSVKIITQGCPGLVEAVERGDLQSLEVRHLIERYTAPLLAQGADTLILGCTHYPFLAPLIRDMAGENIALVDTGAAVARQLQRRMQTEVLSCRSGFSPTISTTLGQAYRADNKVRQFATSLRSCKIDTARPTNTAQFFTSGDAEQASRIMSLLCGETVVAEQLPQEFI